LKRTVTWKKIFVIILGAFQRELNILQYSIVTIVKSGKLGEYQFGPKRDEVTGGWRKRHNEELHSLYSSLNIIRIITPRTVRWVGYTARMGKMRNAYKVLVGKPEANHSKTLM
jgi:hypothetical protein